MTPAPPTQLPVSPLTPQGGLAQPVAAPPQPQQPMPNLFDVDQQPVGQVAGQIDPEVLSRPVKITIKGSSRMLSRAALQGLVPLIGQLAFNGPFLSQINQLGDTFNFLEFFRLVQDATGLGKMYNFIVPMTPQQQQAHSTPPPQIMAQMQMNQQDLQTRMQLGQMKAQTEQSKAQLDAQSKQLETHEASARHILSLKQQQAEAQQNGPDPRQQQLELASKVQELQLQKARGQQELQHQAARTGLELQANKVKNQQDLRTNAEKHALEMLKVKQVLGQQVTESGIKNRITAQQHNQKMSQTNEAHKQKLTLAKKAQAAKPITKPKPVK